MFGGDEGDRTPDLLNAIQTRSQLRHAPIFYHFCAVVPFIRIPAVLPSKWTAIMMVFECHSCGGECHSSGCYFWGVCYRPARSPSCATPPYITIFCVIVPFIRIPAVLPSKVRNIEANFECHSFGGECHSSGCYFLGGVLPTSSRSQLS